MVDIDPNPAIDAKYRAELATLPTVAPLTPFGLFAEEFGCELTTESVTLLAELLSAAEGAIDEGPRIKRKGAFEDEYKRAFATRMNELADAVEKIRALSERSIG